MSSLELDLLSLELDLTLAHMSSLAQFVPMACDDESMDSMRSSFHAVRDSLMGSSQHPAALPHPSRSPLKTAARVVNMSLSRPARELDLLLRTSSADTMHQAPILRMQCTRRPVDPSH